MNLFTRQATRFISALLLTVLPALCQSSNGSVRGIIEDSTKAVIPNAQVSLTNTATGVEFRSVSNEAGLYSFPAVIPGPYKLTAESAGMKAYEATLTVRVQEATSVDIVLAPAGTTTAIKVEDVTPMLRTDNPTLGHTLERQRIEQLPINGRQVSNLLSTVPGMEGLRAFGVRVGTADVILDGAALTDAVYGGTISRQPSLESIEEFRVENNSASAKFTRQSTVVLTTKSGTNMLHGSLFETARNSGIGVARNRDNFSSKAAHFVRNEFGGTAGGPVYIPKLYDGRNKSFWFASYEAFRQRQGGIAGFRVPTEAMRNGDFRQLRTADGTPIAIYDPYSTNPTTFQRNQFAYRGVPNTIDPAMISPLAKYIYSVLPLPTLPEVNPLVANNYFAPQPDKYNQGTFAVRFDHRFSDKDSVYVRLTNSNSERFQITAGVPTLDQIGNSRIDTAPNKSLSFNHTHTFSPSLFNEFLFSATRSVTTLATGDATSRYANELGLPNPNNQVGYPIVNDIGVGTGASNYFQPQNARSQWFNYFILDDNATKIRGRHEFQFGIHLRYDQLTYMPQQQGTAGSISFAAVATGLYDPAVPNRTRGVLNTGHVAASAFLGLANYRYQIAKGKYYMRQNEDAFYFQDNFKVTKRMTLNLGVRWQFSPYPKDKYDIFSAFDVKNMAIVLPQSLDTLYKVGATTPGLINTLKAAGAKFETPKEGGFPDRLVKNNWRDIGPHVGWAYKALDGPKSFVMRAGFSISYFPLPIYGWNDRMRLNVPFTSVYLNQTLTAGNQSPDGLANYGLISPGTIVAGRNSANAIDLNNPSGITIGGESFQTAFFDPNQPTSRVYDWNYTIEKELTRDLIMRVAYVGNHSSKQDSYDNVNEQIPNYTWLQTTRQPYPTGTLGSALMRPLDNKTATPLPYGDIQVYRKDGWGNGNGAQVEIEKRYSKGVGFQAFYNLMNVSKAAAHGWYADSLVQPVSSFLPGTVPEDRKERMKLLLLQRDTTVPKHRIRFNWILDVPVGRGRAVGKQMSKWLDAVVGGWQVTGIGTWRSNYFTLPTNIWPVAGRKVEYYGHKYPIQDCRSGSCIPGYLMWNGYIPAHQINSVDANTGRPNGVMGVPSDYKPAAEPLWPYPADYANRNRTNDPNFGYYGSNTVIVPLANGTTQEVAYGAIHPWINQPIGSTNTWVLDASVNKTFVITERIRMRFQVDAFNAPNVPGNSPNANSLGLAYTNTNANTARQLQLSGRLSW